MADNGRLPAAQLGAIPGGRLRKDAARSWRRMRNRIGQERGIWICPTSSRTAYRTYNEQVQFWNLYQSGRGNLAAYPGSSNHGWGIAVDVPTQVMRASIDRFGADYGWSKAWSDAPSEWWHLRYAPEHDRHRGEPVKPPQPDYAYLTDGEKRNRRKLMRIRQRVRAQGGWRKAPEELERAKQVKATIRRQRAGIKAEAKRTGWDKRRRRERYNALGKALRG